MTIVLPANSITAETFPTKKYTNNIFNFTSTSGSNYKNSTALIHPTAKRSSYKFSINCWNSLIMLDQFNSKTEFISLSRKTFTTSALFWFHSLFATFQNINIFHSTTQRSTKNQREQLRSNLLMMVKKSCSTL